MLKSYLDDFVRQSYIQRDVNQKLLQFKINPSDVIDCSMGVNTYGCSPRLKNLLTCNKLEDIKKYSNAGCNGLREAIIDYWSCPIKRLSVNKVRF